MKDIDSFETKLDLPELGDVEIEYEAPVFSDDKREDVETDYKFLRDKMRYFMASGEFILQKSINALNSDPSPRMIEASSLILRNILKISERLIELHKDTKIILKEDVVDDKPEEDNKISASLVDIIEGIKTCETQKAAININLKK